MSPFTSSTYLKGAFQCRRKTEGSYATEGVIECRLTVVFPGDEEAKGVEKKSREATCRTWLMIKLHESVIGHIWVISFQTNYSAWLNREEE